MPEKTGFSGPQKKAGGIKLCRSVHKAGQNRNYSPRDHDSPNPFPRTPAFNDDGSGDLEQDVGYVPEP
jgi:hypothetical protein